MERVDAPVYVAEPDGPDGTWLLGDSPFEAHVISAGERLPFGIDVFSGRQPNDLLFWVESRQALVCGDTLVDFGRGLEIHDEWPWNGVPRDQVVEALRRLLELPVQLVLPAHGRPTDGPLWCARSHETPPGPWPRRARSRSLSSTSWGSCLSSPASTTTPCASRISASAFQWSVSMSS